jgi:amino acid transporter
MSKNSSVKGFVTINSIVFMNIAALLGVRWFSTAGKYGAGSILLWIIAAVIFFVPMALICAEFSSIFPESKGGMIGWIKEGLGEKPAFYASWMYYISFYFYFPAVLTFVAIALAYAVCPSLAQNKAYTTLFVIISYWCITFIVLKGYKTAAKFASMGGLFGVTIPIIAIVILSLVSIFILQKPIQTDYSLPSWIPHLTRSNILFIPTMALAMAGVEISSPFASKMKNPAADYPKAIVLSAICVTAGYIIGTVALTFVISPSEIGAASGILEDIAKVTREVGFPLGGRIICIMIAYASLAASCIILFGINSFLIDGNGRKFLPEFITRKNKDDMPKNIIIIQGIIITIIVLVTSTFKTVEAIYTILIMVETILMFLPYLILIIAYIKTKKNPDLVATFNVPGKNFGATLAVILVTVMTLIAVLIPVFSVPKGETLLHYESMIVICPLILIGFGWLISKYAAKKYRENPEPKIDS